MKHMSLAYLDDVLVRLAHHSSAIEGNTISLADTVSIILHGTIPGAPSKREFYEIDNHRGAFEYVLACVNNDEPLSISLVNQVHRRLMDRLAYDAGTFKQHENAILGADLVTATVRQTPMLMQQWVENTAYQLSVANEDGVIEVITSSHIEFEKIHPYSDGNGRTGRMLMNFLLLKTDHYPLIIKGAQRTAYLNFLATDDVSGFTAFAKQLMAVEADRSRRFLNKEAMQVNI
ncbi:MAG: Fic family protein [Defluviitaleaceae bacterium]|nr:Fic family protein [Defluviitaleaceae bacterium]